VLSGIVSGLMGLAISVRERSVEVPSVDTGAAARRGVGRVPPHTRDRGRKGLSI
jgi:hypothetical protein